MFNPNYNGHQLEFDKEESFNYNGKPLICTYCKVRYFYYVADGKIAEEYLPRNPYGEFQHLNCSEVIIKKIIE